MQANFNLEWLGIKKFMASDYKRSECELIYSLLESIDNMIFWWIKHHHI